MALTTAHWIYAIVTLAVILTMIFRRGIVLPALLGTFLVAYFFKGSIVGGFTAVFKANLTAAKELFSIFLIIAFMVALLNSLKDLGADRRMIKPVQKVMTNGHVAFFVLVVVTFIISLFFWPTPAVPLIGALLVPAAVRSGLPIMGAAMAVAIAGQGMALSSDYIMQIAPELSAKSAGIDKALVVDKSLLLSLITGVVALLIVYLGVRKQMREKNNPIIDQELKALEINHDKDVKKQVAKPFWGKVFALVVPISMLAVMIYMFYTKVVGGRMSGFEGGDGAAFIGGVAAILLIFSTLAFDKKTALDRISDHIVEGFLFAFKAMGPVIPIAGFFFLGSSDYAGKILSIGSDHSPAFLFDLVKASQHFIPDNVFVTAFSLLIIGMITGLDGSGFSGLPLTGALSGALASSNIDPATLAAIGQMGSIWTGGGTIIAWSSLVAVAGFCGVPVMELARKNFIPVIIGLVVSTLVAIFLW